MQQNQSYMPTPPLRDDEAGGIDDYGSSQFGDDAENDTPVSLLIQSKKRKLT